MDFSFQLPTRDDILARGRAVPVALRDESWSPDCLGPLGRERGVYVIHQAGQVLYVGKTDGATMSFGVRLRRSFQESASQGRHIFPRLASLQTPPEILVSLIPAKDLPAMVSQSEGKLTGLQLVPVVEMLLVAALNPVFQADLN